MNIVNHIKTELQNLDARDRQLLATANYFMTPLQKFDSKLKAIAKIQRKRTQTKSNEKSFCKFDDEDKKQHEKEYKEEYEKIRKERNNMANTYTTQKSQLFRIS